MSTHEPNPASKHAFSAARSAPGAFVLALTLTFGSEAQRGAFVELWRPLAEWVRANEPRTLSYECALADRDPCQAMILERYVAKDDLATHQQSEPFAAFKRALAAAEEAGDISRICEGMSYYESTIGYVSRD